MTVSLGKSLLHQGRISADEIDPDLLGRLIERFGNGYILLLFQCLRNRGDGGYGKTLIDDGDPVFVRDPIADSDHLSGNPLDLGANPRAQLCG